MSSASACSSRVSSRVGGDVVADEGAGPLPSAEESLAAEPVVGHADGAARDGQTTGQLPGRRQPLAGRQAAVQDGAAQLPVDLAGQVVAPDQADVYLHQEIRPDRTGPVRTRAGRPALMPLPDRGRLSAGRGSGYAWPPGCRSPG